MADIRTSLLALVVAAAAGLAAMPSQATVVIDRSTFSDNAGTDAWFGDVGVGSRTLMQTFFTVVQAGSSGTLSSIGLKLGKVQGTGLLELVLFDGGRQGSTAVGVFTGYVEPLSYTGALTTVVFDVGSLPTGIDDVTTIDVNAAGLVLDPGHIFSFMLRSIEPVPALKLGSARTTTDASVFATTYGTGNGGIPYFDDRVTQLIQFQTFIENGLTPIVAGVPEPASWALMVAGFGLVGGAIRRRRSSVAVAC